MPRPYDDFPPLEMPDFSTPPPIAGGGLRALRSPRLESPFETLDRLEREKREVEAAQARLARLRGEPGPAANPPPVPTQRRAAETPSSWQIPTGLPEPIQYPQPVQPAQPATSVGVPRSENPAPLSTEGAGNAAQAFGRGVERNLGEAVGGAAGAWVGAKAGGAAGAAIGTAIAPGIGTGIGGLIGLVGGSIAGMFGGGWLGKQAQKAVMGEEAWQRAEEQYQRDLAAHPLAALGGSLAPHAATLLVPGGAAKAAKAGRAGTVAWMEAGRAGQVSEEALRAARAAEAAAREAQAAQRHIRMTRGAVEALNRTGAARTDLGARVVESLSGRVTAYVTAAEKESEMLKAARAAGAPIVGRVGQTRAAKALRAGRFAYMGQAMTDYFADGEYNAYAPEVYATTGDRLLSDAEVAWEAAQKGGKGFWNQLIGERLSDPDKLVGSIPFLGSWHNAAKQRDIEERRRRLADPARSYGVDYYANPQYLRDRERVIADENARRIDAAREQSIRGIAGQIIGDMPAFMVEIANTPELGNLGAARGALAKVGGGMLQAAIQSNFQPGAVAAGYERNRGNEWTITEDEWGALRLAVERAGDSETKALWKGWAQNAVEYVSETMGEYMQAGVAAGGRRLMKATKPMPQKLGRFLADVFGDTPAIGRVRGTLRAGAVQPFFESLEERAGDFLKAAILADDREEGENYWQHLFQSLNPGWRQWLAEQLAFLPLGGVQIAGALGERRRMEREDRGRGTPAGTPPAPDGGAPEGTEDIPDEALVARRDRLAEFLRQRGAPEETVNAVATATDASQINDAMNAMVADAAMRALRPRLSEEQWGRLQGFRDPRQRLAQAARLVGRYSEMDNALLAASAALENEDAPEDLVQRTVSMLTSLKPEWRELAESAETPREALMEIAAQANAELADGKLDPAAPVWKDVTARDLAARLHGAEAAAEDSRIADLAVEALVEALPEAERAEYDGLATAGERSQWLDRRLRDPNAALNSVLAIGRHIARPDIDAPGAMLAATLDQLKGRFGGAWALAGGDEARGTPKERLAALVAEIDKDEANKRFLDAFAADNGATDSLDGAFEEMPSIVDADLRPPEEGGMAEAEALAPIPGEGAAPAPVEAPAPVAPPPGMPLDATESAPAPAPAYEPSAPAPAPQEATEAPETPPAEESTELPPAEERYTREQLEALDADTLRGMVRATGLPTGGLSKTPLINILMHIQDEALTWEPPEITAEQRGKSTAILSKWLHDGDTILFADGSRGTVSKDGAFGAATIRTDQHGDVSLDEDRKLRVLAVYRGEAEVTQDLHVTSRGNAPDTAQEQKARADRIAKRLPGVRVAVVAAGAKGIPPRIAAKFRANPDGKAMFDEETATIYLGTQSDLSSLPHEVFHAILHWSRTKARGLHGQLSKLLANPPASALEWAKRHYPGATADALREEACAELWGRALAEEIAGEERREADRLADALAESEMPWWDKVRELCARILEKFVAHVPETSRGRSNDGAPIDLGTLSRLSPEQAARRLYDAIFAGTGIDWQGREWTDEELPRRAEDAERKAGPAPTKEPAPILSGDEVRKTMPGYDPANWRTHVDRTGYVGPRMEARFQELLKTRKGKGNGEVVFLAGGNGVGKSTVAGNLGETPDFIIDSTLGNLSVARKQIDAILANGQKPVVFFVYRTPEQALDAIQGRVENGGHAVSPLSFADSHTKSLENLRLLSDEYGDKVEIHIVDNSVEGAPEITIEQLEAKGKPNHAAIRKRANEVLGRYQGALGGDVGAQSPDQGGGGSTGEEGGGRPDGTRRPRNAPAAPAGLETPPAGGTPAQEDLSAKTADEVRAIAKGLGIKTGGKPKSRLIAEIQAKTAPKTAKPGDEFANRILDAIETDARDGLIAVFADNRFGDGAYVANYADGSREEVERAAAGIRRAFLDMEVLASDTGLVVKPKKEAAAATQRKPAAESPMDRAKAAAEKHVVTYGQGLKATLAQMIEKGDARLYPDKGLLTFDKGKPHVVTIGFEQFTPTKAELPYLVQLQKDYDAAHPNELPPSQRGQNASPAAADGKTDLEKAQDHLNALREELRQHEEAQRGVAYAFTEDGRKARKDAEDYTARLEADIADAERRVAELGGTVEKEKAAPPTPKELANKSTSQLHRLAKENGLPTAGTRTELLMRLAAHFGQQARALQQGAESGNVEINQQGVGRNESDQTSSRSGDVFGGQDRQGAGTGGGGNLESDQGGSSQEGARTDTIQGRPLIPETATAERAHVGENAHGTGNGENRGGNAGAPLDIRGDDGAGEGRDNGRGGVPEPGAGVDVGAGNRNVGGGNRTGGPSGRAGEEGGSIDEARGVSEATGRRSRNADNHVITDPDFLDAGGAKAKFRDNLAALRVLKTLREEGREATPEERAIIAKYVGWGRSEFRNGLFAWYGGEWQKEREELEEVIGRDEFESARKSTLTAFWTPPRMAQAVWRALDRLGFKGGRIHEPSIGTGIFYGTMPTAIRDRSQLSGADKDVLASEIARHLYPGAKITNGAFQEENLPDDFYDLVVGNFPFADFTIRRDKYNHVSANLHDYFWLKSLGIVRPGGLVAAITSTGTMDKANDAVRREIAGKADVLAAIRLPEGTFSGVAGTEVVTDLIILRKREPGTEMSADTRAWLDTVPYSDLAKGDEYLPGEVNQYYKLHPDHIVGTPTGRSGRFGQTTTIKLGKDESAQDRIDAILAGLPENVYSPRTRKVEAPKTASAAELGVDASALRDGSLVAKNGEIWENTAQGLVQVKAQPNQKRKARFLIELRDTLHALRSAEINDRPDGEIAPLRKELNRRYDAFVKEYGPLSKPGMLGIMDGDPSSHMLLALERSYDKDKNKAVKADIFTTRVGYAKSRATHAENYEQAAGFSMNETGRLDAVRVGEMMGVDTATAERELLGKGLAYRAPDGQLVGADEYLSGNVREKLHQAEAAARVDSAFTPNVEALRKVLPADKGPGDITVNLGATWVPSDVMSAFSSHILGLPEGETGLSFEYNHALGRWLVSLPSDRYAAGRVTRSTAWNHTYSTAHRSFTDILDAALHDQRIRITRRDPDTGETEFLAVESEEANTMADKLKDEFLSWVWKDKDRATRLSRIYNDTFNGFVERKKGGRWLTFPGIAPSITPRQHQVAAVEKLLACRRLLMAHEVGTGKTITYGLMARKAKETGIAAKPLLVVTNTTVTQVAAEIQRLFPDMNIFVGGESMTAARRKRSMAQIANNNWDLVILTHDNLASLDADPAIESRFIDGQIMELRAAADAARNSDISKKERERIERNLLKRAESLTEKLKSLLKAPRTDGVSTFQDLGFDMVMVDECQVFKKLPIATYRSRVKGIPVEGSKRASALLMNIQNLLENNPEACVVFGSGTPLDNSLVEAYVWQRYLQNDLLRDAGITSFDAWASNFGRTTADIEMSPSGGDWKEVERFKEFVNLGELSSMMRQNMDVVFAKDTGEIVRPTRHDSETVSPETETSREVSADLQERARKIKERHGKPQKGDDNMLVVCGDGRKAAVHPGLYKPEYVNAKGTKAEACIKRVAANHKADPKAIQMIFCDCGVNDTPWGFNLYRFLRDGLIKAGFKPSQVAFFSSGLSRDARAALAEKMNNGEVLVAIGSTDTMGTGVNAQKRLRWMHHLDASRRMTPGSIEQRNGRGHRQGNAYKDVEVVYYTQQSSLDAFTWNLIKNKAGFIGSFMRGEDLGTIEEESDTVSYDQLVASASGDPRVLQKAQLEKQLHRLRLQEAAFEQSQRDQAADKRNSEWQLKNLDGEIKALEAAVEVAAGTTGKPFSAEVVQSGQPGGTYTERDAALSSALGAAVEATATRLKDGEWLGASDRVTVAKYRGFDIQIGWERQIGDGPRLRYYLEMPDGSRTAYYLSPNFDRDDKQTQMLAVFRSADAIIGGLKRKLQGAIEERANTERRIGELAAGLDRKFENAGKITSIELQLQQINDALSGKDKEKKEGDRVENPEESATKFQRGAPARDWSTATIPEMRKELVRRGLSPSGSAAALRRRLEEDARQDGEGGGVRWQKAAPMLARQLDRRPKVRVYRAMQMVDGKLYPPMAAKVGGKWVDPTEPGTWYVADEHPELAIPVIDKRTGKQKVDRETGRPVFAFKLDKGNSSSITAAYNPYWHTSRTPLNDQFSSASKRPELVIVECEVPASELSSGYRADKAKDTVGEKDWHSGPVSSWLAEQGQRRKVILSRYSKVVRVVPDAEVAAEVRRMLDGTDISVPEGVVTPALRAELERLGVDISRQARSAYSWDKLAKDGKNPRTMAVPRFARGAFGPDATRNDMVETARESVRQSGGRDTPSGLVLDIPAFGEVVVVGRAGIEHGLRPFTNYGAVFDKENADILPALGGILKNSIPINELQARPEDAKGVTGATVLLGAAMDDAGALVPVVSIVNHIRHEKEGLPEIRVYPLKSVNAKSPQGMYGLQPSLTLADLPKVNVADLVDQIKDEVPVFSRDVYDHFKQERPDGDFSHLRFQRGGTPPVRRDWSAAKIPELRRELVARGLSPAGGADRLRQRLADDDAQRQGTEGVSSMDLPDRSGQERPEGGFSNVRFQRGGTPPPIANPWDRAQVEYLDKSSTWRVVLREETEEEGKRKVKTTVLGRYATREAAEFALRQEQAVLSAASEALGKLPKARLAEIAEARRQLVDVMRRADATKEERADAIAAIGRTLGLHKDLIAKEWALAERILRTHDPESTMDAAEKAVRAVNTVLARASIRLHGRDMMRLVKQKAAGQVTGGLRKNKLLPVVEAWTLIRKQMTEAEKAAKLDEMDRAIDTLDAELSTGEGRPLTAAEENAKRRELAEKKHARELFAVFGGLASLHGGQNRARLAEDARAWAAASKALASLSDKAVQELEAKLTARAEDAKQKREGIIHDLTGGKDIPASNQEREDAKNARGWFERAREIVRGLVSASMGGGTAWGEVLTRDKSVAFGEGAASHLFHDGLDAGYRKEMEANMADKREGLRILAQFFDIDIDLEKPDELVKVIDFSEKCSSLFNEEAVDQDGNHEITVRSVRVTGAGKDRQVHVTASGPCTLKLGELMHFYLVGLQAEAAAGQAYTDIPKHTKGADCSLMEALVRHGYSAETMMEIRTALAKRGLDKLAMQISADMEKKGDALDALMASEYNSQLKRVHPYAPLRRLHWGLNEQGDAGGGGVGSFMSMVRSFMKERVANLRDFQTVNLIESWQSHNRQANHIIHLHDWISTVGRVMRHADMQTALDFVVGDRTRRALNAWLDIQARGGSMVIRDDDRMGLLARNFAVAVTTNPRIALKQLTSPGMALGMLPPGASTIEWFKDMARIAFPCEERRAFLAFLDGNSPEWRERGLNASDALSLINRHKAGSKYELLRLRVQRRLGAMTRWGDRNGALLGCYGVFRAWERKFLDEGMEAGAAKIAALEKFDESVNAGQQSVLPEYMSQVQTMGGLYKYMTMFHTAQIAMTRNLYIHAKAWAEGRGNRREHERAIVGVVTSAWAFRLMGMGMLPLAQIILGILQGDPDKFKTGATKTLQEGVLSLVEAPASGVMPWGDAIVGLADRFVKGGSAWGRTGSADIVPQLSVLANVDRIVADFSKKADKRDWLAVARHASDLIGQTTGYPVTPAVDAVSGTIDAWTAPDLTPEQRVARQFTFSRSAIGAPRRPVSRKPTEPKSGGG